MLSIFTTPKPFLGHIDVIQRNALKSWTLLHPGVEVILLGDDDGAAEAAKELGIRHDPYVERNEFGSKRLDYLFNRAQATARYDTLCYVNCDIILLNDFPLAVEKVKAKYSKFLVVGRRWDTPINEHIDFNEASWDEKVRALALSENQQRDDWWIDYFVFSRGVYGTELLPLVIGTVRWDNWLVWKALDLKLPVIDASQAILAVHQNHDYSHHPQGRKGVWEGPESQRNLAVAGGWRHIRNISHATKQMVHGGRICSTWSRRKQLQARKFAKSPFSFLWYGLLDMTYEARHVAALNRSGIDRLKQRFGLKVR
jgi:hypothetical protein